MVGNLIEILTSILECIFQAPINSIIFRNDALRKKNVQNIAAVTWDPVPIYGMKTGNVRNVARVIAAITISL